MRFRDAQVDFSKLNFEISQMSKLCLWIIINVKNLLQLGFEPRAFESHVRRANQLRHLKPCISMWNSHIYTRFPWVLVTECILSFLSFLQTFHFDIKFTTKSWHLVSHRRGQSTTMREHRIRALPSLSGHCTSGGDPSTYYTQETILIERQRATFGLGS